MAWWVWIVLGYFAYRLASEWREQARIEEVARIEAELKSRLVDRLGDPELVRKLVESRLPLDANGREVVASAPRATSEEARPGLPNRFSVLGGLITFLVGLAFVAAALFQGDDELVLPGLLCLAVGLALLTYATSQPEIRRQLER